MNCLIKNQSSEDILQVKDCVRQNNILLNISGVISYQIQEKSRILDPNLVIFLTVDFF